MCMKKSKISELGFWALRLTVGIIFINAGWMKLADMGKTVAAFSGMGFSSFWAWIASIAELVGGIAVILGVATHIAAGLLAITMVVATIVVLRTGPFMMAYAPIALLGSTLALFGLGGGACQLWKPKGCSGACCKSGSDSCKSEGGTCGCGKEKGSCGCGMKK